MDRIKGWKKISLQPTCLATGSIPNKFGWKGQEFKGVQGLYTKQDLERLEAQSDRIKQAVIVGWGLIGIELAEMLHARGINVHFLVREKTFWNNVISPNEGKMIENHIVKHGIHLHLESNLIEIDGDENGYVRAVMTDKRKSFLPVCWTNRRGSTKH